MKKTMSRVLDGWFSEICPMWPGVALSFEIEKILYRQQSRFQLIEVFETKGHGRMLALDGIIQLTESDEFAYHEMLAHVPLFSHPAPKDVLVIGGGDGGVLREIQRHDVVQHIDFCEIDPEVMAVSQEFFPSLACGFDDPRIQVHIGDGSGFVTAHPQGYDVIIVDSSDPIGPGEALFEEPFYRALKQGLKPGGLVATQGESFFMHKDCVKNLVRITRELFDIHAYSTILVPTYPGGNIGICLGSLGPELVRPARPVSQEIQDQLKYYTPQVHGASFVLPRFAQKLMEESR